MVKKRNIVLITLDSARADHFSFMGYHRETTPVIDKMAKRGIHFENAIASGVATPTSMFGVHTGTYPNATYAVDRLNGNEWRKEIQSRTTIAQVLSSIGYMTGAIHANPAVSRYFGFNKGFQYFQDFLNENKRDPIYFRIFNTISNSRINNFIKNIITILKKEETATDWCKLMPYIEEFINLAKKENKPYFLWVLLLDTHIPYIPPKDSKKWCKLPAPYIIYLNWKIRRNYLDSNKISNSEKNKIIDAYDDTILYADKFIKILWSMLKDDDPVFIIHADHGEGFGEHDFFYHPAMLYEELLHVPLVIYNLDMKRKISEPVSLRSIPSTILELVNIEDDRFPSKSILKDGEKFVISKVFDGEKWKISIRTKNWKYILGQKKDDELYFIKEDNLEQKNLINDYTDVAKDLKEIIKQHLERENKKIVMHKAIQKIKRLYRL